MKWYATLRRLREATASVMAEEEGKEDGTGGRKSGNGDDGDRFGGIRNLKVVNNQMEHAGARGMSRDMDTGSFAGRDNVAMGWGRFGGLGQLPSRSNTSEVDIGVGVRERLKMFEHAVLEAAQARVEGTDARVLSGMVQACRADCLTFKTQLELRSCGKIET